jgi:D-amino-acid dehydrogenase
MKVIIIGGGIMGISTAYSLISQGVEVVLIDNEAEGRATYAGAGILSPGNRFPAGDPILPFLKLAHDYMPALISKLAAEGETDTSYKTPGVIHVAATADEAAKLPSLLQQTQQRYADGFKHIGAACEIDFTTAKKLFPLLNPFIAAIYLPDAGQVNGSKLTAAMQRAAINKGLSVQSGTAELAVKNKRIDSVTLNGNKQIADHYVIAAGVWTNDLLKQLNFEIPLVIQRGEIAHTRIENMANANWPVIMNASHYLLSFPKNNFVIGASKENAAAIDNLKTVGGVREILNAGYAMATAMDKAQLKKIRVGYRPVSPDALPILGKIENTNLYVATGLGGYGLQAGPYAGETMANIILGIPSRLDLKLFAVERFNLRSKILI